MIGEQLRKARLSQNMTLQQVADKLNVSKTYILRLEQGKDTASLEQLKRICEAMNCELRIKITKK